MSLLDRVTQRPETLLAAMALACVAALAAALVSQHVFDMPPCPWCVLQRLIFVVIALVCVAGLAWRSVTGRRVTATLALLLADGGVAAAAWQHWVAAKSQSCNLTLADRIVGAVKLDSLLPEVFYPYASCADAAVDLLGVPYALWSLALFVLLGLAAIQVLRRAA